MVYQDMDVWQTEMPNVQKGFAYAFRGRRSGFAKFHLNLIFAAEQGTEPRLTSSVCSKCHIPEEDRQWRQMSETHLWLKKQQERLHST